MGSSLSRPAWPAMLAAAALGLPLSATATTISVLNNGDFETPFAFTTASAPDAVPYGEWAVGDGASTSVAAHGITPLSGSLMFHFGAAAGTSDDVYQVIDVSAYAAEIDAGLVTADLSAYYNSASATSAGMSLFRYTGPPTAFSGNGFTKLVGINTAFSLDGNLGTWQQFGSQDVLVTAGTRYLMFGLNQHTIYGYQDTKTYVDDASVVLNINDGVTAAVPEPSTLSLVIFGLGLPLFARARRMRKA